MKGTINQTMTNINLYVNAIISTVAKYHAVSPEGLLEAWNEMEQHKDICYAKTAYDIINALGWLANLYAVYGKKAGRVLRRVWICTECHHEYRSLADYMDYQDSDDAIMAWNRRCGEPFPCDREKCKGCEQFGWVCDLKRKGHGYFTCRLQNKKCADTHITAEFIIPQHFSESQIMLYDD